MLELDPRFHENLELKSYFRSEYRDDAEWAYNEYLENQKKLDVKKRKSYFKLFRNFLRTLFQTEHQKLENYLSKATSHEDLERRHRIWNEVHSQKKLGVSY